MKIDTDYKPDYNYFPGDQLPLVTQPDLKLGDFRYAIAGRGPKADEYSDKPHRLIFDLITEIKALHKIIDEKQTAD